MPNPPLICPSILASDFARPGEEIREPETTGADWIHVDVMDGHAAGLAAIKAAR